MKAIEKLYKGIILIFFVPILLLLEVLTVEGSCYLNQKEEVTFFVKDNSIINITVVLVVLLLMFFLCTRWKTKQWLDRFDEDDCKFRKLRVIILGILWIMSIIWVISTKCVARADQAQTLLGALGLYEGDYTLFQTGGYLQMYPNQIGLVQSI